MSSMKTLQSHQEEIEKVVLYVDIEHDYQDLSHEDRLKLKAKEVTVYLGETTKGVWGDDWNDAPDEHNSGPPYEDTVKGLEKITIKLGEPLPFNKQLYIKIAEGELKRLETKYKPRCRCMCQESNIAAIHNEAIQEQINYWTNILQELNK